MTRSDDQPTVACFARKIAWISDPHLNFVPTEQRHEWYRRIAAEGPDAIILTGDIAEAKDVTSMLCEMDDALQRPLFFVLGNHDFYFGSIHEVRAAVSQMASERPNLCYLSVSPPVALSQHLGLVGHDGWADGRIGNYERSFVMLNDYRLIRELAPYTKESRWDILQQLGDEAAETLRQQLQRALAEFPHVLIATHVPPWREACWYQGQLSDDEWAPHFTCQAMGQMIGEVLREHPHRRATVLCGHTHSAGEANIAANVVAWTAGAEYGTPQVARLLDVAAFETQPE